MLGFALILIGVACIGGYGLFMTERRLARPPAPFDRRLPVGDLHPCLSPQRVVGIAGGCPDRAVVLPDPAALGLPPLIRAIGDGLAGPLVLQALLQGFVAGAAGIVLYGIAIDRLGASRAAAISPLSIVLAALLAIPVLGEIPDA